LNLILGYTLVVVIVAMVVMVVVMVDVFYVLLCVIGNKVHEGDY